jgi:hypothetical protein
VQALDALHVVMASSSLRMIVLITASRRLRKFQASISSDWLKDLNRLEHLVECAKPHIFNDSLGKGVDSSGQEQGDLDQLRIDLELACSSSSLFALLESAALLTIQRQLLRRSLRVRHWTSSQSHLPP